MNMKKYLSLFFIVGWLYIGVEVALRAFAGDPLTNGLFNPFSLAGWASLWMFFVGGTAGFLIGWIDEFEKLRKLPMIIQALIGGFIVTVVELLFGLFFNTWLGLALWDYSTWSFNFMGQIALLTSSLWILISPFAFWMDNVLRHYLYGKEKPETLFIYYKKLITLK